MSDEMDEFENLLKAAPAENEQARKSAINSGMEAFDQFFAKTSQGTSQAPRLMDAVRNIHNLLTGGYLMKNSRLIVGGLTVGLAFVLLSTSHLSIVESIGGKNSPSDGSALPAQPTPSTVEVEAKAHKGDAAPPALPAAVAQKPAEMSATLKDVSQFRAKEERVAAQKQKMEEKTIMSNVTSSDTMKKSMPQSLAAAPMAPMPGNMPARAAGVASPALAGGSIGNNGIAMQSADSIVAQNYEAEGRDKFEHVKTNALKVVKEEPVSTFSIDVDTSSYSFMRASLNNNILPQKDSVRVEEMVNYFPYEYEAPKDKETPFKANVSVMPTPWNAKTKLIHIGIKGYDIEAKEKPHSNLVFLIDTSGSMNAPNKLPLLINSFKLLLDSLKDDDSVGIVTYAGNAGVALEPTLVKDKSRILAALDSLQSYGSTAGAEGIRQAYQLAEKHFDKAGVNRVILATDGDFNVGITDQNELKGFIERERNTGIFLSVLGFGSGNYNDALMQTLAQNGNGNAAYIDNLMEARKALLQEASSTLFTIAKDVKIQVEFNPSMVSEYRLVGYETRMLNREDFNNDKVDAGDIGSGHTVTALYEITPAGSDAKLVDERRYSEPVDGQLKVASNEKHSNEYAFVKIRYKQPDGDTSKLITTPVDSKVEIKEFAEAPQEARFAVSVAAFAQLLRGDSYTQNYSFDDVIKSAQAAKGDDQFGYRAEFINLVRLAQHAGGLPAAHGRIIQPTVATPPMPVPMTPSPTE